MAAELIPVRLALTAGDRYTLWAPRWRDSGDEWEAFLGSDDDLYGFESAADLVAFVRAGTGNDLTDHPAWEKATTANAHRFEPTKRNRFDLVGVEALLAEAPTEKSVNRLAGALELVSSIGAVCELPAVTRFFNGNPGLGLLAGGIANFTGRSGRKRWYSIAEIVGHNWDGVLDAIDAAVTTPEVDAAAAARAADELAEPAEDADGDGAGDALVADTDDPLESAPGDPGDAGETADAGAGTHDRLVLGSDANFWTRVGIDPIRILTGAGTFHTLRCYLGDPDYVPVFLGRNGRISVFGSERALARYLADEHDHDLSDLATYDDIRTAATDGSLAIDVTDDNVYVLTGLADDFADGPDAVDREQLELAVEFLRDVGVYAEDAIVDDTLKPDRPLGRLVSYVLDPESVGRPMPPYAAAIKEWEALERFVESRLRRE